MARKKRNSLVIIGFCAALLCGVAQDFFTNEYWWYKFQFKFTLLLASIWIFSLVSYSWFIGKGIALWFLIDRAFEFIQYLITEDKNDGGFVYIQNGSLIVACLYLVYRNFKSKLKPNNISGDGVYWIISEPNNFFKFVFKLSALAPGSVKMLIAEDGHCYYYGFKNNVFCSLKGTPTGSVVKLPLPVECKSDILDLVGAKYHILRNNCYSIYNSVLKKYGIKVNNVPFKTLNHVLDHR
jgi:hypothetical protein